jgi:uncharacterized protein YdeI (BOF family)
MRDGFNRVVIALAAVFFLLTTSAFAQSEGVIQNKAAAEADAKAKAKADAEATKLADKQKK